MTLFPSALRTDRLRAGGVASGPVLGLKNLVTRVVSRRRPFSTPVLSVVAPQTNGAHHERPEPLCKWTDPHTPPPGDFAASAVPNAEIGTAEIPRRGDSWEAVSDFALSYDGYEYWDDLPELASRCLQRWTRSRTMPATLDELRGCLFYEQRRWHHFGEDPTGRSAEYMRAIVDAISAVALPPTLTTGPVPDPRQATAPEAHVRLVAVGGVARTPVARHVHRLVPVAAAEAHVRLVSAIEDQASAKSRHPSGYASRRDVGNPTDHPSMTGAVRDLRPMPSAEPLPKPPVIVRRSRRDGPLVPNRPGGAVNAARTPSDTRPSNGSRREAPDATTTTATEVTPLCHEFSHDDAGYLAWVEAHPRGFVMNQPRAARPKTPTMHRVGCAAVSWHEGTGENLTANAVKVCGPSADVLGAWSVARGGAVPTACRRCRP
jgi:hypothetical protein